MADDLPLKPFSYSAPTLVHFGAGSLARLGSSLRRMGASRALLICDAALAQRDVATRAAEASQGRVAEVWSGVERDAPRASVEAAAEEARSLEVDAIVALGDGSVLDTGKAAALLAKHGGDLARWDGVSRVERPGLPVVTIPTTAGTGSEVSSVAVVTDSALGRKLVLVDRALHPQVALLDPALTTGLSPALTAATGLDALAHVVEGLVSTWRHPLGDAIGLESVRLIRAWLPRAVAAPADLDARGTMLLAASMAGQLVSATYSGVGHAVANALGIGWGISHGTGNAVALPWSIRFNTGHPEAAAMYARCAAAFGVPVSGDARATALAFSEAVERFVAELGLATRLSALGLKEEDLDRLGSLAFADPLHASNLVKVESAQALADSLRSIL